METPLGTSPPQPPNPTLDLLYYRIGELAVRGTRKQVDLAKQLGMSRTTLRKHLRNPRCQEVIDQLHDKVRDEFARVYTADFLAGVRQHQATRQAEWRVRDEKSREARRQRDHARYLRRKAARQVGRHPA